MLHPTELLLTINELCSTLKKSHAHRSFADPYGDINDDMKRKPCKIWQNIRQSMYVYHLIQIGHRNSLEPSIFQPWFYQSIGVDFLNTTVLLFLLLLKQETSGVSSIVFEFSLWIDAKY